MCETCGCTVTSGNAHLARAGDLQAHASDRGNAISVFENLLSANNRQAAHNRAHFNRHGVLAVNLMSSPGAGKTLLLEATVEALKQELQFLVIEGDLETENDAARIRAKGVPAIQITTGSACHLDAQLLHDALHTADLRGVDVVLIENVGNLVCPASFDLGQHHNVILLSTTEGDDKPAKYPVMFRTAELVVMTKCDLLPVLDDFNPTRAEQHLRALASEAPLIALSAKKKMGLDPWFNWLRTQRLSVKERLGKYRSLPPHAQPKRSVLAR